MVEKYLAEIHKSVTRTWNTMEERGKGDQIFINTTGVGRVHPKADIAMGRVQPGDRIIVSGPIAAPS